jgi:hypothetical protein
MLRSWIAALALLAACDKKQEAKPSDTPVGVRPEDTKRIDLSADAAVETKPVDPFAGWTERKGDGFSVLAPQAPRIRKKDTTGTGKPLPTTMYTHYAPDGNGAIQVMFTELDPTGKIDANAIFAAMKSSMMKQFASRVIEQKDIVVAKGKGQAIGQEYWLDGAHPRMGRLSVHVKFVLADRRLYIVQSLHTADATDFAAQGDKFLDSFKLL